MTQPGRPSWKEMLLRHIIVFAICIVFPGLTTSFLPATWITFQRSGQSVNCTARTCVFFIVPFKVQSVQGVTSISHREKSGGSYRERSQGRETGNNVHRDGQGSVQIEHPGPKRAKGIQPDLPRMSSRTRSSCRQDRIACVWIDR